MIPIVWLVFELLILLTRARLSVMAQTEWMEMKRSRNWFVVVAAILKASTFRKIYSM